MEKRRLIFFGLVLFLSAACFASALADTNASASSITSYATALPIGVGARVIGMPALFIWGPVNETYLINESLILNYSISDDVSDAWYTIDGSAPVPIAVISSVVFFNTTDGPHNLTVYANNSMNTTAKSVIFIANSTRFVILYREDYRNNHSGASTDFYRYTYEKIQNLSGICLENTNYGKACFNEGINVTNDRIYWDNFIDIEGNIYIEFNRISVNRYELPNFNVPARLWLYGLNFTNPRIMKDNTVCSYYVCPIEDYTDGVLRFRVNGFSNYSAEETPENQVIVVGGGGGGGGGGTRIVYVNGTGTTGAGIADIGKYFCGLVINGTGVNVTQVYCGRCYPPYIVRGTDCCLDSNKNNICDVDEKLGAETPTSILAREFLARWSLINILLVLIILALLAILAWLLFGACWKKESKQRDDRLTSYEGMKVCSKNGTLIGKVDEAILENKRVLAWRIFLKHELAENMKRESIIVRREHVHSIKDVIVLDAKTSDYLGKFL